MPNIIIIVLGSLLVLTVLIFLVWKNKKDKKLLNPDAQNSVKETKMDQERRKDKI